MQLKSNIGEVRKRMMTLQRGIPGAVQEALNPEYWLDRLRTVARGTLQSRLAMWGQAAAVDATMASGVMSQVQGFIASVGGEINFFVDQLRGEKVEAGSRYTGIWDTGRTRGIDFDEAHKRAQDEQAGNGQLELADDNLNRARDAVEEWVNASKDEGGKDLDRIHDNYDPEAAKNNVLGILGLTKLTTEGPNGGELGSENRRRAAENLTRHITAFLNRNASEPTKDRLDEATTRQWLEAVAVAWRDYVRRHLPERVNRELQKLNRRTAAGELL